MNVIVVLIGGLTLFAIIFCVAVYMYFFRLWFSTHLAGAPVSPLVLVRMPFRKVVPSTAIESYVKAAKAGVAVTIEEIQDAQVAGADMKRAIDAMIAAKESGRTLRFSDAIQEYTETAPDGAHDPNRAGG